jgi:hypothetical protein
VIATLCVAALSVGFGCGGDDDDDETAAGSKGSYVGTVEGTKAYIALVSSGGQVSGYVCDGTPKAVDVYFWLDTAKITDGSADLVSRRGDPLGEATFEDGEATGEVKVDGKSHSFTAEAASGEAGLYRGIRGKVGESGTVEAGWIVLNNGTQRGGVGVAGHTLNVNVEVAPNFNVNDKKVEIPDLGTVQVGPVSRADSRGSNQPQPRTTPQRRGG